MRQAFYSRFVGFVLFAGLLVMGTALHAQQINLGTQVKGILGVANGGLGADYAGANGCLLFTSGGTTVNPGNCNYLEYNSIDVSGVTCTLGGFCQPPISCGGDTCTPNGSQTSVAYTVPSGGWVTTGAITTSSGVTLPLNTTVGLPAAGLFSIYPSGGGASEFVGWTLSGGSVTLTSRGKYTTTATAWPAGSIVYGIPDSYSPLANALPAMAVATSGQVWINLPGCGLQGALCVGGSGYLYSAIFEQPISVPYGTASFFAGGIDVAVSSYDVEIPNDPTTSVVVNELACINPSGNATTCAAGSPDWSGVAISTLGTGAVTALVAREGFAMIAFDNATTVGDFAVISSTTAGYAHDTGSATVYPTSGVPVGRVMSTRSGGGTARVSLYAQGMQASRLGGTLGSGNASPGTGAGTGATVSVTGLDGNHVVTVTTGTSPASNSPLATVTFTAPRGISEACLISPTSPASAALYGAQQVVVSLTGPTYYGLSTGSTALAPSTTYGWSVSCP